MPTETLDPRELELWKPAAGTKFRYNGKPCTVVGTQLHSHGQSGRSIWCQGQVGPMKLLDVLVVARLVRDQGGAT